MKEYFAETALYFQFHTVASCCGEMY